MKKLWGVSTHTHTLIWEWPAATASQIPVHTPNTELLLLLLLWFLVSLLPSCFFFPSCCVCMLQVLPPSLRPNLSLKSLGRCRWTRLLWVPPSQPYKQVEPSALQGDKKGANWYFLQVLFFSANYRKCSKVLCAPSHPASLVFQGNVYPSRGTSRNPFIWPPPPLFFLHPPMHLWELREKWTWGVAAISMPLKYFHPLRETPVSPSLPPLLSSLPFLC